MIKMKKGAMHVEVILSFVIFISFVIFLLVVFNPLKKYSTSTTNLDTTEEIVLDVVSTNLTITSLRINTSAVPIGVCASLGISLPKNIIVKDESFSKVSADRGGGGVVRFIRSVGRFFKIYSSDELVESPIPAGAVCIPLTSNDYTQGVSRVDNKVAYSKLVDFNKSYYTDYEQFKDDLNLTNDFNVAVKIGSEYLFKAEKYKPKATEVMARDVPVEILDKNANLTHAIINIQVWD